MTGKSPKPGTIVRAARRRLVTPEAHVEGFELARTVRRNELVEDYVELIADLLDAQGEVRQVDIAERMGVAQPTVARMLKRLTDEGWIERLPYRGTFLTDTGRRLAEETRDRHTVVETFLLSLGIDAATARKDAEGIEHHVSPETLEAFRAALARRG